MTISIPIANTMEYIANTQISPLISKGYCKVCYVDEEPNRNDTVITKAVATEMGRKLPGSPVVGYYNQEDKDFEGHNRELIVREGQFELIDTTRPYGFVPNNANVWFEKFAEAGVEREYLCCDVYIWTGAYPEASRILDKGNNQSMELTESKGFWTNHDKTNARVFIYNEALIEKLCVLGENVEPCFEGAQFGTRFSFTGDGEELLSQFKAIIEETLGKGGSQEPMEENKALLEEQEFEKKPEDEEEKKPPEGEPEEKKDDEEKKKYDLAEVVEYADLKAQYDELNSKYEALSAEKAALDVEVASLKEFKLAADRKDKQSMIDSFYMLSDNDKQDVIANIDTYSLEDIEAKLSIICVRNKVSFSLDTETEAKETPVLFNLNTFDNDNDAPAWLQAVRETAKQ